MKYFIDTEFLEGPQDKRFLGFKYGHTKPTIDLISIGIVSEDGREYYEISKDFNLKEAWNRYNLNINKHFPKGPEYTKEYWIRENVLKPIFDDLVHEKLSVWDNWNFTYKNLKKLINKYGKSNKEIAKEVRNFVMVENYNSGGMVMLGDFYPNDTPKPEFYAYFGDYDWTVFCWLFGRMIDLPKGFPMYCRDLKQILDEKVDALHGKIILHYLKERNIYGFNGELGRTKSPATKTVDYDKMTFNQKLEFVKKEIHSYPKQENEHNALDDAKWNLKLFHFLQEL